MRNANFSYLYVCANLALLASPAWAQVGAPVLGYLPASGYLLPVRGIPASASIGSPVDFGGEFLQIAVSPRQDFALVSSLSSGAVLVAYPTGATTALTGTSSNPSSIALSPSGSAAVLWFASAHLLEIVSGLPSAPVVRSVNASFLSGASSDSLGDLPAALAVSDDGAWGAGAWPGGVWAFGPNGEVRSLLSGERGFALGFFAGREDLAVATGSGVSSIADVGGSATVSPLYTSSGGLVPMGLAISSDNRKIVLSGRGGGVVTIDASTGAASQVDCGCAPEGVFPMGGSAFRLTGLTGSVFKVFDSNTGSVFMVPLAPGGTPGSSATPVPKGDHGLIGEPVRGGGR